MQPFYFTTSLFTILLLAGSLACRGAEPPRQILHFDTFLERLEDRDPEIEASRRRWEAVREGVPASGVLPEPEVTLGYFFSPVETRVGPQEARLGLFQKLPWPDKLKRQRALAESGVDVAYWEYLQTIRDRLARGKSSYVQLARLDEQLRILERQDRLFEDAIKSLEGAYESGRGELSDLLLLKQRRSDLRSRLEGLRGERQAVLAEIRRLEGRETRTDYETVALPSRPTLPQREPLLAFAVANNEFLKSRSASVDRAGAARELAASQGFPDITFGLEYTPVGRRVFSAPLDNGEDAIMGSIRITLPIRKNRYGALERSAQQRLGAERARLQEAREEVRQQVDQAYARVQALERQLDLYREQLIPQGRRTLEAVQGTFASGRADVLRWIEAQRHLLDSELGQAMLHADYLLAVVALERLCAVNLFTPDSTVPEPAD